MEYPAKLHKREPDYSGIGYVRKEAFDWLKMDAVIP